MSLDDAFCCNSDSDSCPSSEDECNKTWQKSHKKKEP